MRTSAAVSGAARVARRRAAAITTDPASGVVAGGEVLSYRQASPGATAGSSPAAVAETPVAVDVAALATSDLLPVELTLPDGRRYRAVAEEIVPRGPMSLLWRGRLVGDDGREGKGFITVHGGHVAGRLTLPDRVYELAPDSAGGGVARLLELDGGLYPPCRGQVVPPPGAGPASQLSAVAGETAYVDVVVVYTPRSRNAAGGRAAMEALIQGAVDSTNDSFANSRAEPRAYLVATAEVPYDESGIDMAVQLEWLRQDRGVADLRRRFGADAVAMISEAPPGCGIGYVMREVGAGFAPWAFSVTHRPCAVGSLTFAHELGHNMGLEHDPPNGPPPEEASYPWSFGHFVPNNFHTVMAYWTSCGRNCLEIPHFSNPAVSFRNQPTGIAGRRHNARTLDLTGVVVERFRAGLADPPNGFTVAVARDRGVLVSRAVYSLSWNVHPLADGYHVYRFQEGVGLTRVSTAPVNDTSFVETGPVDELGRGYAVSAVLPGGVESRRTEVLFGGATP